MPDKLSIVSRTKILETAESLHQEAARLLELAKLMQDNGIEQMPMLWSTHTQDSIEHVESMVSKAHLAFKKAKRAKEDGEPSSYEKQLKKIGI